MKKCLQLALLTFLTTSSLTFSSGEKGNGGDFVRARFILTATKILEEYKEDLYNYRIQTDKIEQILNQSDIKVHSEKSASFIYRQLILGKFMPAKIYLYKPDWAEFNIDLNNYRKSTLNKILYWYFRDFSNNDEIESIIETIYRPIVASNKKTYKNISDDTKQAFIKRAKILLKKKSNLLNQTYKIDLDHIIDIIKPEFIELTKSNLFDSTGSIVDAKITMNQKLILNTQWWTQALVYSNNEAIDLLILHEVFRLAGYNDDHFKISLEMFL